ncbi:unnamed protein product [Arabidopsis halleri]
MKWVLLRLGAHVDALRRRHGIRDVTFDGYNNVKPVTKTLVETSFVFSTCHLIFESILNFLVAAATSYLML